MLGLDAEAERLSAFDVFIDQIDDHSGESLRRPHCRCPLDGHIKIFCLMGKFGVKVPCHFYVVRHEPNRRHNRSRNPLVMEC